MSLSSSWLLVTRRSRHAGPSGPAFPVIRVIRVSFIIDFVVVVYVVVVVVVVVIVAWFFHRPVVVLAFFFFLFDTFLWLPVHFPTFVFSFLCLFFVFIALAGLVPLLSS
jgi:hypothetical protein